jgi:hypothetical protein
VRYTGVYPGIDLVYHGQQGHLEYDFDVAPGADASSIHLAVEGADQVELSGEGDLVLHTQTGELRQPKPVLYLLGDDGQRQVVDGGYVLDQAPQQRVGFWVGTHDLSRQLVIDPVLVYSTYLGGSGDDGTNSIAVDAAGNAYVTGFTESPNFPNTLGAFQPTLRGASDAFVVKLNPSGTALVYSTFLGGSGADRGLAIVVDAAGDAYVPGDTTSTDFPTTMGAFEATFRGGFVCPGIPPGTLTACPDGFVTKLNANGTALLYSTYLGGTQPDHGRGIAVDAAGDAYVTGDTSSTDFPTTAGAFQTTASGTGATFITKVNPTGTALIYSTYFGGSGQDYAFGTAIAVDSGGNAYFTGGTSGGLPISPGALQPSVGGGGDAYVAKLNPTGTMIVYATYLGESDTEQGSGIAIDASGDAYVTGLTFSTDFPTTPLALQRIFGGIRDGFVAKLSPTATTLVYSTYLGGSLDDVAVGIAVDAAGDAYVTGETDSPNFPTVQPLQATLNRLDDAFISKLNPTGTSLIYSTYLGGNAEDGGTGLALDAAGNAYVSGSTFSIDFPTTPGAFQPSVRGGSDAFVAKIATQLVACTATLSGAQGSLVIQPDGTTCLEHATVSGSVQVRPGARLSVEHSSTTGPIVADAPASIGLCDSSVRGAVSVSDASGFVLVGDPTDDACGGNTITAGLVLQNNHSGVEVGANHIGSSASVNGTSGNGPFPEDQGAEIEGNVIGGSLACSGNNPAPKNDGQLNSVAGSRNGQCVGL